MKRRSWLAVLAVSLSSLSLAPAWAQVEAPDAMVKRLSNEVLNTIKADPALRAGDMTKIVALVDAKIMPNVNFERLTQFAVARHWSQATPEQQKRLQEEFKTLLLRTYSGALSEVKDQTLSFRPFRANPTDTEVQVRSFVKQGGGDIQLDYKLEKTPTGWKVFDLNVMGAWLGENYRTRFAQEAGNGKGVDGILAWLAQTNKNMAGK